MKSFSIAFWVILLIGVVSAVSVVFVLAVGPPTPPKTPLDIPCTSTSEVCDGLDNDCSGIIDDNLIPPNQTCIVGNGSCARSGVQFKTCLGAAGWSSTYGACSVSPGTPGTEICNGLDDDCSGIIDDHLTPPYQACTVGNGTCARSGVQFKTCLGAAGWSSTYGACSVTPGPAGTEVCDGLDNDCDGFIDDNLNRTVNCGGLGACAGNTGVETCYMGNWTGSTCNRYAGSMPENCADNIDNNCDGSVNEGCSCTPGNVTSCGATDVGACSFGTQTCSASGQWGVCLNYIGPATELCDGLDNDCNNIIDDVAVQYTSCTIGFGTCARTGNKHTVCSNGVASVSECNVTAGTSTVEVCNGLDDDCNGIVDDVTPQYSTCTVGVGACARVGTRHTICADGVSSLTSCNATAGAPSVEICNGIDDNCDGNVDENQVCNPSSPNYSPNPNPSNAGGTLNPTGTNTVGNGGASGPSRNSSIESPTKINSSGGDGSGSTSPKNSSAMWIIGGIIFLLSAILVSFLLGRKADLKPARISNSSFASQQQSGVTTSAGMGTPELNNYNHYSGTTAPPMIVNPYIYRQHQQYLRNKYLRNRLAHSPQYVFQQYVNPATPLKPISLRNSGSGFSVPSNIPQRLVYPSGQYVPGQYVPEQQSVEQIPHVDQSQQPNT